MTARPPPPHLPVPLARFLRDREWEPFQGRAVSVPGAGRVALDFAGAAQGVDDRTRAITGLDDHFRSLVPLALAMEGGAVAAADPAEAEAPVYWAQTDARLRIAWRSFEAFWSAVTGERSSTGSAAAGAEGKRWKALKRSADRVAAERPSALFFGTFLSALEDRVVRAALGARLDGPLARLELRYDSLDDRLPSTLRVYAGGDSPALDAALPVFDTEFPPHARLAACDRLLPAFRESFRFPEESGARLLFEPRDGLPFRMLRLLSLIVLRQAGKRLAAKGRSVARGCEYVLSAEGVEESDACALLRAIAKDFDELLPDEPARSEFLTLCLPLVSHHFSRLLRLAPKIKPSQLVFEHYRD